MNNNKTHSTGIQNITLTTHYRWNGGVYKYFIFRKWVNYKLYTKSFETIEEAIEYKEKFIKEHYKEINKRYANGRKKVKQT